MAAQKVTLVIAIVVTVTVLAMLTSVQAAFVGCNPNTMISLMPCLAAVTGPRPDTPSEDCCVAIRSTEPTCMCNAVTAYAKQPNVNLKAALMLPHACGRSVPTGFMCDGYPVPSAELHTRKLKL